MIFTHLYDKLNDVVNTKDITPYIGKVNGNKLSVFASNKWHKDKIRLISNDKNGYFRLNNKTIVTYKDGSEVLYDINGDITSNSAPFRANSAITIEFGEGVKNISANAFTNCGCLEKIVFNKNVTYVGGAAFAGCKSLKRIELTESIEIIATDAFNSCSSLEEIIIPNSVESFGVRVFLDCSNVKILNYNSPVELSSGITESMTSLTSLTIGDSVTSIGSNAFREFDGLTSVVIPNSVESIGDYAFYATSLTSVTISDTTEIGESAFSNTGDESNLYYISSDGSEPSQSILHLFQGWNLYINGELIGEIVESTEQSGEYIVEN